MPAAALSAALIRLRSLELAACLLALALLSGSCFQRRHENASAITIAYIGNYRGFQRPCGCVARQDGGLPRLEAVLQYTQQALSGSKEPELPDDAGDPVPPEVADHPQKVVLIDCGNFAQSENPLGPVKARTHLEVLKDLGAAAAVVGGEELALPAEGAITAFAASPLPLISCNVRPSHAQIAIQTSADLGAGWRLIGVTVPKPGHDSRQGWATIQDPFESVSQELKRLPAGSRAIVAGAQLSPALCAQLATLPLAAIIGGSDAAADAELPIFPAAAFRGQRLLFASLYEKQGQLQPAAWGLNVSPGWRDSAAVMARLRSGEEQQRQALRIDPGAWRNTNWGMTDDYVPPAEAAEEAGPRFAGAAACLECHAEDHAVFEASGHRHAYQTLLEHQEAQTLDCLGCHVTGLLKPGGYDPLNSPDVLKDPTAFVGCESCHGPAAEHVRIAQSKEGDLKRGVERSSVASCLQCHDEYNSPQFDAQEYWAKIAH